MNKIYKVIWSKARNCYVVVSELAKRNGKCSSSLNKKIIAAFLAAGMTMAATVSVEASAVGVSTNSTPTKLTMSGNASGTNSVAVGDDANAKGNYSVAVGNSATTIRRFTSVEAQVKAYNALQQTIKSNSTLRKVTAVQNATNYTSLVNALSNVDSDAAKTAANIYITQLNNLVATLQNATADYAIAIGNNATAGGSNAIAMGRYNGSFEQYGLPAAITTGAWGQHDIAIGTDAAAHGERKDPTSTDTTFSSIADGGGKFVEGSSGYAIAVGYRAQALRQYTIAVGEQAMATGNNATAIGHGARALTQGSIAIGGQGNGTSGVQQGNLNIAKDALDTIEHGGYSITIGNNAMNFTSGYDSVDNYFANTKNSISIGHFAHTHAANAFAIGTSTDATAERAFAIGTTSTNIDEPHRGAHAGGQGSLAFGDQAVVGTILPVDQTEEQRRGSQTEVNDAISVGTNTITKARNAVALGGGMSYTYHAGAGTSKMTNETIYWKEGSGWVLEAEGTGANVGKEADGAIAIGGATGTVTGELGGTYYPTGAPTGVDGYTAAATIGDNAKRAVAIGSGAVVSDNALNAVTVGARNIVSGVNSSAVGAGEGYAAADGKKYANMVTANASAAFGNTNKIGKQVFTEVVIQHKDYKEKKLVLQPDSTTRDVFVVGGNNEIAKDNGNAMSIGVFGSTNKIEGAGLSTKSTIIGNSNEVTDKLTNSLVAGNSNTGLDQVTNSQIIGNSNTIGANVSQLVVLGNSTTAAKEIYSAIAIGQGTTIGANNAIAMGNSAKASKENALAVGKDQEVAAKNAGAFGVGSYVSGESSYSVGNSNNVYAKNALAMGNNIIIGAGADNSIALGEQSVIDNNIKYGVALGAGSTASREEGDTGYDYSTNKTSSATSTAWQATHAAVSVGDDGNMTRQITGVAAGSKDTDAVNVAQLKQVQWNIGIDVESVGDPDDPDNPPKGTVPADRKLDVATTVVGPGTNKVKLIAGEGMTLSGGHIEVDNPNDGYGIVFSTDFQELDSNKADEVSGIKYKGRWYSIATPTSPGVAKVTTDHRAVSADRQKFTERQKIDGEWKDVEVEYRVITSPYLNINGIADPNDTYKAQAIPTEFWSNASGTNAIAMGREADATAENALAVGHMAESTNPNTTSLGYKAHALANNAVALGTAAFSTGNRSIAVGTSSVLDETKTTSENYQRTWAAGQGSIALGNEARAVTEDERFSGKTKIDYETNDAIAIGTRADARAMNAIALGGNMSYSDAAGEVTYGKQEGNDRDFGATVGEGAKSAISIGGAYGSGKLITETIDGEKVSRLDVTYEAAATYGARGIAIGTGATVANPEDFLDLKAMVDEKGADGYQKLRKEYYAARAKFTAAERDLREYETAHKDVKDAEYDRRKSEFDAAQKALFGTDDEPGAQQKFDAKIQEKIKLELKNAESVEDAVAIGTNAKAEIEGAVALGSNSRAEYLDRAGAKSKLTGYDVQTGFGYSEADATSPVWMSTAASVAIGSGVNPNATTDVVTRRISSVAAGVFDTDAVNVAQLKRATNYTSDERNVTITKNSSGSLQLSSPFLHINGVDQVAEALDIASYDSAEAFQQALQGEFKTLSDKIKTFTDAIENGETGLLKRISDLNTKANNAEASGNTTLANKYRALVKDAEYEEKMLTERLKLNQDAKQKLVDEYGFSDNDNSTTGSNGTTTVKPEVQKAYDASVALKEQQSQALGKDSIAIGKGSTVTGNNSIAVGTGHKIYGKNSGAFGDPTEIDASVDGSYAIGNSSHITTSDSFVLGNNVTTAMKDSVYLGSKAAYNTDIGASTAGVSDYSNVKINGNAYTFAGGKAAGIITVGDKGTERRIQNVAAGLISQDSTDAINGSQLYAAMQALSIEVIGDTSDTKSTIVEPKASDSSGTSSSETSSSETDTGEEINIPPAITYEVKASTTKVNGSKNIDVVDINEVDPLDAAHNYDYKISLKEKLDLGENGSVTIGNTTLNSSGVTVVNADGSAGPKITQEGIDAAGKKITNVERGTDPKDAVNFSQLQEYAVGNNQAITNVDSRARKGIAGAAALAALHPMDFDPDDKLTFAAGMGHYRGETAAAIGAFYRADEKVMFSVGGTVGNGENVVNAGVSFSLDRTPRVTGSRTALTKEVVHLREQVARQDAQIAKQDQQIAMQGAQIAQLTALVSQLTGVPVAVPAVPQVAAPTPFPDNLDNKWAYDVIEDLEQRGYFTGYAGRELTRDEFAAALDRAIAGGAKLEERLIKEFEPELSHVRVAHVEGKGNNEGEWYERPRVSHDKYENKHEIAKKYSRVQEKKVTSKS
ncbi:MAG: ESPR-type extended signal peptide-containing protein [Succiniclasticum sp.]|uniref:ESPR-type extended signal peptide-containing protein n=1 Tax=Succiniclasticum sp. TaxID=2775030 RepID=UPI002A9199DF|nr:ESPR-type extended signal peptide-containing protein [Succiniclasticum sp.]MDY6290408.1 ESPR-type extended signal peptide-containing protein [Succiniclasticum sp.]